MDGRRLLRIVGLQCALIAAGLHVVWGLPRLVVYVGQGTMPDARPLLFTLSAVVIVAAVAALFRGADERPIYALLIAIMVVYLLGFAGWHLAGHPVLGPDGVAVHHHPEGPVAQLADHLRDGYTLATVLFEVGAIVALAPLLRRA